MSTATLPPEPIPGLTPITASEISTGAPPVAAPPSSPPAADPATPTPVAPAEPKTSLDGMFGTPAVPPPATDLPNPGDPPAEPTDDKSLPAKLRAQLAEVQKKSREEQDNLRQKYEEEAAQRREIEERFDQFQREMAITDPTQSPEVVQATGALTRNIDQISRTLPPTVARAFMKNARSHIDAWGNLGDINDPGYDKRHEELSRALAKEFGAHGDEVMRRLPELSEMAEKVKTAVTSASSSSGEVLATRARQSHDNSVQMFNKVVESTLSFSEELAQADPLNVRNIVANLIKQVPDFAEQSKQIKEYLRAGLVVPAPLSPEAEVGLTPDQRRAALAIQAQNFTQTSQNIYENTPLAFHAQAALPFITEMYLKVKRDYDAIVGSVPSPTSQAGRIEQGPAAPAEAPVSGIRPITMQEITQS